MNNDMVVRANEAYRAYNTSESRYNVVYGGAGSGKSYNIAESHLLKMISQPRHRFLFVRKVANTLRASMFQLMRDLISKYEFSQHFRINKSDMTIEYIPSGSQILFFGLDDVEKLKSIQGITSIWIEEASEIVEDDFIQLDLRLRGETKYPKQITLSFNPISSSHWLKKHFFDNNKNDTLILKTTYKDNRYIDERYKQILDDLQHTNKSKYQIYALGDWGVLEGLVYEDYKVIDDMPKDLELQGFGGDFGWHHQSAIIHCGVIGNNLYLDEIIYQSLLTNSELITLINQKAPYLKSLNGYMDSAEPDRIQEFKNANYRAYKAKKDILFGVNKVKEYKIHITKRSLNILREIQGYVWQLDKENKSMDIPVDLNNHAMDAIRYFCATYKEPLNQIGMKLNF